MIIQNILVLQCFLNGMMSNLFYLTEKLHKIMFIELSKDYDVLHENTKSLMNNPEYFL